MNEQVEKQVSEVEDAMNTLSTATDRLINAIDRLEVRLSSVLKPPSPTNETKPGVGMVIIVPLAVAIKKEVDVISEQTLKVEDILLRLGI
jgi:hypothetical protein